MAYLVGVLKEHKEEILAKLFLGALYRDVAKEYNVTVPAVYQFAKKYGVRRNKRKCKLKDKIL